MAFAFTYDQMEAAMTESFEDGIDVKGIFETRASETEFSDLQRLFCAGVSVRQDGSPGAFHHKVIIVDEEILITDLLNFSANADDNNDENVLVIRNKEIAAVYIQEFERRWAEAQEPGSDDMGCK